MRNYTARENLILVAQALVTTAIVLVLALGIISLAHGTAFTDVKGGPGYVTMPACSTDSFVPEDTHPCIWDAHSRGNGQGSTVIITADDAN